MGEVHVNMVTTLDGVIQANGGPSEQDGDDEYAGWERPFWDAESGKQLEADVQACDALLLGGTTYDIFRSYWPSRTDELAWVSDRVPNWVLGKGKKLFPEGAAATRFEQVEPPRSYPAGVMLLRYRCLEGAPETARRSMVEGGEASWLF